MRRDPCEAACDSHCSLLPSCTQGLVYYGSCHHGARGSGGVSHFKTKQIHICTLNQGLQKVAVQLQRHYERK